MAKRISTSKERIAEMMTILNIKQIDIVKRTGIPKSSLSNYLSGKRTPNQEQLSVISDPYGINPAWLMGYDVPMWLKDFSITSNTLNTPWADKDPKYKVILTKDENNIIMAYRTADDLDRRAVQRILGVETKKDIALDA